MDEMLDQLWPAPLTRQQVAILDRLVEGPVSTKLHHPKLAMAALVQWGFVVKQRARPPTWAITPEGRRALTKHISRSIADTPVSKTTTRGIRSKVIL